MDLGLGMVDDRLGSRVWSVFQRSAALSSAGVLCKYSQKSRSSCVSGLVTTDCYPLSDQ